MDSNDPGQPRELVRLLMEKPKALLPTRKRKRRLGGELLLSGKMQGETRKYADEL